MEAILKSLGTETDRAVALVGASLVEYALEEAIKCRLRPLDKKEEKADLDRLLRQYDPLLRSEADDSLCLNSPSRIVFVLEDKINTDWRD